MRFVTLTALLALSCSDKSEDPGETRDTGISDTGSNVMDSSVDANAPDAARDASGDAATDSSAAGDSARDARADSGRRGDACDSNTDCKRDEYCDFGTGPCSDEGECTIRPAGCDEVYAPVCGCDGTTYPNDCSAAAAGVDTARGGTCCAPVTAVGTGDCRAILGARWDGEACEEISGCDCEGRDCGILFTDERECNAALQCGTRGCDAMMATAAGPCGLYLGAFWDGNSCQNQSGCECNGPDCGLGYESIEACETAHEDCD